MMILDMAETLRFWRTDFLNFLEHASSSVIKLDFFPLQKTSRCPSLFLTHTSLPVTLSLSLSHSLSLSLLSLSLSVTLYLHVLKQAIYTFSYVRMCVGMSTWSLSGLWKWMCLVLYTGLSLYFLCVHGLFILHPHCCVFSWVSHHSL